MDEFLASFVDGCGKIAHVFNRDAEVVRLRGARGDREGVLFLGKVTSPFKRRKKELPGCVLEAAFPIGRSKLERGDAGSFLAMSGS